MCLAEALVRIPDAETVDRLIRDKIASADWQRHLGHSGSLFVNASTWALMLTGRLLRPDSVGPGGDDGDLGGILRRFIARSGEPVWRQAVTAAMRILAAQFIIVRTIEDALALAIAREPVGWDGLGLAVQAYQRRAAAVIDWLAALAGRARRLLMVRLVKGAYWDSEIMRSQERGLYS